MLSYSNSSNNSGYPIARDGPTTIYYHDNPIDYIKEIKEANPDDVSEVISEIVDDITDKLGICSITTKQLIDVDNDIIANELPTNRHNKRIFSKAKDELGKLESKYYAAQNDKIIPVPSMIEDQTEKFYIAGSNGSGKSYWAKLFALEYLASNPGNKIFLISRKKFDKSIDPDIPDIIRIKLDRNFIKQFSKSNNTNDGDDDILNMFSNSLVIFDDYCKIDDKDLVKSIDHLKNTLLELGRQYGTSVISIQHKSLGGMKSTTEFVESSAIVCFPIKNEGETRKVLKNHLMFTNEEIKRILDEEGRRERWLCILKPNIIITENYIKIID